MSTAMETTLLVPDSSAYGEARLAATHYRLVEATSQKLLQQIGAWERFGIPVPDELRSWYDDQLAVLDKMKRGWQRSVTAAWRDTAIADFVDQTHGLGPALFLILSLAPPIQQFANPAKLWRYLGLHAARATDRKYNARLKAWCLFRLAEPAAKQTGAVDDETGEVLRERSPYRDVYDRRRQSRPEMVKEGEGCATCDAAYAKRRETGKAGWDCHNMGGPHYKAAHAQVDALGVTAKAILLDAWRVAHGQEPKHGSVSHV